MSETPQMSDPDIQRWTKKAGLPTGTVRPVTLRGNPVLHQPCPPVTKFDGALRQLVADMFATMEAAEGVGLAANQIGVAARVFVYHCPDAENVFQTGVLINPTVVAARGAFLMAPIEDDEGCLSVPGEFALLARPGLAEVEGQDLTGAAIRVRGDGVLARCLLHETDHLNGVLYVDRLSGAEQRRVLKALADRVARGDLPPWSEGA